MEFLNEESKASWINLEKQAKKFPQNLLRWREAISKTYKNCEPVYYLDNEFAFPFFLIKSKLFGNRIISLPFLDFGGPIGKINSSTILEILKKTKEKFGEDLKFEIRLNTFLQNYAESESALLGAGFKKESDRSQFILNLKDEKKMWEDFDRITRKGINKAIKSELKIEEIKTEDELKNFYSLYLKNMKKFGTPQHSFSFFKNLFEEMKENFRGLNCYKEGKLIGSLIVLLTDDYMYAAYNFSDSNFLNYQPNDLLYWEMIKWASEKGIKYFDFGQCEPNAEEGSHAAGIYNFKKKWGGILYERPYFYFSENQENSDAKKSKNKYKKMINVWKKLPLPLIKLIGPKIASELAL